MSQSKYSDEGFFPACSCPTHEPIPSTVFDPFGGTGTTAQVARALGRSAVLCELNDSYHPLIAKRLEEKLDPATLKPMARASARRQRTDPPAPPLEKSPPLPRRRQTELFT